MNIGTVLNKEIHDLMAQCCCIATGTRCIIFVSSFVIFKYFSKFTVGTMIEFITTMSRNKCKST